MPDNTDRKSKSLLGKLDKLIDYVSEDLFTGFIEDKGVACNAPGYLLLRLIMHPLLIIQGTKYRREANQKLIADLGLICTDERGKKYYIYETADFFEICVRKSDKIAKILTQLKDNRWLFGYHVSRILWLHYDEFPTGGKAQITTDFFFEKLLPLASDFMSFRAKMAPDRPFTTLYPQFMAQMMQSKPPVMDKDFSGLETAIDMSRINRYLLPYLIKVIAHIQDRKFNEKKKTQILDALLGAAENFFAGNLVGMINRLAVFSSLAELNKAHIDAEAKDLGKFVREAVIRYTASYEDGKDTGEKHLNLADLQIFPRAFDQFTRTVDFETITAKLMSGKLPLPAMAFPSGSNTPATMQTRLAAIPDNIPPTVTHAPLPPASISSNTLHHAEPIHPEPSGFFGRIYHAGGAALGSVWGTTLGAARGAARGVGIASTTLGQAVMRGSDMLFSDRPLFNALDDAITKLARGGMLSNVFEIRDYIKIFQKIDAQTLSDYRLYDLLIRRADEIEALCSSFEKWSSRNRILNWIIGYFKLEERFPILAKPQPDDVMAFLRQGSLLLKTLKNHPQFDSQRFANLIREFIGNLQDQQALHPESSSSDHLFNAALALFSNPNTLQFFVDHAPLLHTLLDTFLAQDDSNNQNRIRKLCVQLLHQASHTARPLPDLPEAKAETQARKLGALANIFANLCNKVSQNPASVHCDSIALLVKSLHDALQAPDASPPTALIALAKTDHPYQVFSQHRALLSTLCDETIALTADQPLSFRQTLVDVISPYLPADLQNHKPQLVLRLQEAGCMLRTVLDAIEQDPSLLDSHDLKNLFTIYCDSGFEISSLQSTPYLYNVLFKHQRLLSIVCDNLAAHEQAITDNTSRGTYKNPVYFSDLISHALPFLDDDYGISAQAIRESYLPLLPSLTANVTAENCPVLRRELPIFLAELFSPPTEALTGDPNYYTEVNAAAFKTSIIPWLNTIVAKIGEKKDPLAAGDSARDLIQVGEHFFSQNFIDLANTFNHLCQYTQTGNHVTATQQQHADHATEFVRKFILSKLSELNDDGSYALSCYQIRPDELDYCWRILGVSDIVSGYLTGKTPEKPGKKYLLPPPAPPEPAPSGILNTMVSWARFIWIRYIRAALEACISWGAALVTAAFYIPIIAYSYFLSFKRWAYGLSTRLSSWFYHSPHNDGPPPSGPSPSGPTSVPRETDAHKKSVSSQSLLKPRPKTHEKKPVAPELDSPKVRQKKPSKSR